MSPVWIVFGDFFIWLVGCAVGYPLASVFVSIAWTFGLLIGTYLEGREWMAWLQSRRD